MRVTRDLKTRDELLAVADLVVQGKATFVSGHVVLAAVDETETDPTILGKITDDAIRAANGQS